MGAMYITRDGVTVTRNVRIIYVYYANSSVTAYRISDKDPAHFFMLVYMKYIYEIPFSKFRKRRSLSSKRETAPVNRKIHRKFAVGKRKKAAANQIGIYRESTTSGRIKSARGGEDESSGS